MTNGTWETAIGTLLVTSLGLPDGRGARRKVSDTERLRTPAYQPTWYLIHVIVAKPSVASPSVTNAMLSVLLKNCGIPAA